MESNKTFAPSGYILALMLFVIPFFDGLTAIWPFKLGEERWRFGAVGSLSNLTLLPLVGLLLAIGIAILRDHRRTRRILGAIYALIALAFAGLAVIFLLDFFQMRAQVKPQFKQLMDIASATSAIKQVLTILVLTLLARAGLSGPKAIVRKEILPPEATPTPLISMAGGIRSE